MKRVQQKQQRQRLWTADQQCQEAVEHLWCPRTGLWWAKELHPQGDIISESYVKQR